MSNRRPRPRTSAVWIVALASACSERAWQPASGSAERNSDRDRCDADSCELDEQSVRASAAAFLNDVSVRRQTLESSLEYTENTYAKERLTSYAVAGEWETLPVFDAPTAALYVDSNDAIAKRDYGTWSERTLERAGSKWPTWSLSDWLDAGKTAYFLYPAQRVAQLRQLVTVGARANAHVLRSAGLWRDASQTLGGLVNARYADGSEAIALTCASCHAQVNPEGELVVGAPSPIDVFDPEAGWGPGRVDVTADGVNDPVAIADLRATRVQRRLHHSGNVTNSLLGLAVRIETLLITNYQGGVRPPRELAFALAVYIWSLGEALASSSAGLDAVSASLQDGARVFEARCASCHAGVWGEGDWVPVNAVGTDPLVATSPARGTGGYRVPTLLGMGERPRGHEARVVELEVWLNGETASTTGEGHAYRATGQALSESDLSALTAYLRAAFAE